MPESTALTIYDPSQMAVLREPESLGVMQAALNEMGITQFQLGRVRVPGGGMTAFQVPTLEGEDVVQEMDIVLAWVKGNEKAWYRQSFDESGGGTPPDCSSHDGVTGFGNNELDGSPDAEPQSYQCASCHWNQWGSKRAAEGGTRKGKDCADLSFMYFFYGEGRLPMLMVVPPTSGKALLDYNIKLMNFGRSPYGVVTRMSLRRVEGDGVPNYAVLQFSAVGILDEEAAGRVQQMSDAVKAAFATFNPLEDSSDSDTPY